MQVFSVSAQLQWYLFNLWVWFADQLQLGDPIRIFACSWGTLSGSLLTAVLAGKTEMREQKRLKMCVEFREKFLCSERCIWNIIYIRSKAELLFLENFFSPGKSSDCCSEDVVFASIFLLGCALCFNFSECVSSFLLFFKMLLWILISV